MLCVWEYGAPPLQVKVDSLSLPSDDFVTPLHVKVHEISWGAQHEFILMDEEPI